MVELKVLVEGGVHPNDNQNADTVDNSASLRESFRKLLSKGIERNEKVRIVVDMQGSYMNATKNFKNTSKNTCLLIDLDAPPSKKEEKLLQLKLTERKDDVFFMVQTMETWILSQVAVLDECYGDFRKTKLDLKQYIKLQNADIQQIAKPDALLNTLLFENFEQIKGDKIKPLKYGKIKNSYLLLEKLNINTLKKDFEDVFLLLKKIKELTVEL